MYLNRTLSQALGQALDAFPAVLLTGPRQSGKTTFLQHELGERYNYVSFDDPLEREFARTDPNGFLRRFDERPALLDEVQYVPELLSYIKLRIDAAPGQLGRWLLTGSQQFALMQQLGESLAGRVAILELLPFSAVEHPPPELGAAIGAGGYPVPALHPERSDLWARSYVRTYLERDVRQLSQVADLRAFERFLGLIAAQHGQELKKAPLARDCGLSQPTIANWISVLEASYVVTLLSPYFRNYGKRLIKSPKLYFIDSLIACTLTRQPNPQAALAGPMGGALLEGWVVVEAVKAFTNRGLTPDIYFWRSQDGLEVDLLVQIGTRLHPVEIKRTATPTPRHVEPLSRLRAIIGDQAAEAGLLVCSVERERPMPHGNRAMPWQEFPAWIGHALEAAR
ncbi:MAG: ATP-binding protein [Thiohalocapsa sp.]